MAIKFNQQYIDTLANAHAPGETVVGASAGVHKPIWALGVPFFFKTYLFIATERSLVLVEHRRGLFYDRVEQVERFAWSEVTEAKVSGLLLKKKLKLAFSNGHPPVTAQLPGLLGPIAKAKPSAKALVETWQRGKALPSTPAPAMIGQGAQYYQGVG